ncbi:MAG TPA: hypothetical protein P5290_01130 [Candidatus Methanomethylicus sp.]|nr:hypothetical protein [Candidatus Methanomethylicus sp.]
MRRSKNATTRVVRGRDIADAFASLLLALCETGPLAIGTACAYHGVIDSMSLRRPLRA